MTFKQKQAAYASLLRDLGVTGSERHARLMAYSGHGPIPAHCPFCTRLLSEGHAPTCDRESRPAVSILCSECTADTGAGELHSDWCSHSDVFAGGTRG